MAFPTGYTLDQNVTIDNTKVGATLTDYPCLVDLSDLVKAGDDVFDTCRNDGGDIRVTLSDGTTQLAREIVSIDTTGKTGEMHVKIPSLASGTDTVIRVWYNGTDTEPAIDSTYGAENVWNSNYKMVQHMNQDPSGSAPQMTDSTANNVNGTSFGSMTSGDLIDAYIGKGIATDGTDDYIRGASAAVTNVPITFSAWAKPDSGASGVILGAFNSTTWNGFFLEYSGGKFSAVTAENVTFAASGLTASAANFHHAVAVLGGQSSRQIFVDGSPGTENTTTKNTGNSIYNSIGAARHSTVSNYFAGVIDEARILDIALSADWIATEYNNQSSPSTFYSVSDEQGGGSTLLPIMMNQHFKNLGVY